MHAAKTGVAVGCFIFFTIGTVLCNGEWQCRVATLADPNIKGATSEAANWEKRINAVAYDISGTCL